MSKQLVFRTSVALLLLGIGQAQAGIVIGNPPQGVTTWHFRAAASGVQHVYATVTEVDVHYCGGGYDVYFGEESVDFADGWLVNLPSGSLCSVTLHFDDGVTTWSNGGVSSVPLSAVDVKDTSAPSGWTLGGILIGNPPMAARPY